jgi:Ca2+-binding EF-hand superfamily protein
LAAQVIAGCLSEEEIRGLKEMFKSMDSDNSGTITVDELRRGLAKKGTKLSEAEVQQLMEAVRPKKLNPRVDREIQNLQIDDMIGE